jgi:protein-disulfide isomerase
VLGANSGTPMLTEYADLQCPYCADFAKNVLPTVVDEYVRTGKMNVTFNGMAFIGPDSAKALRAVAAAGRQNRLWDVLDGLYAAQGAENSGWVTDELLDQIGAGIPGFDVEKWRKDMSSGEVQQQIAKARDAAVTNGVSSTPTIFLDGQKLQLAALTPQAFRGAVDPLLSD